MHAVNQSDVSIDKFLFNLGKIRQVLHSNRRPGKHYISTSTVHRHQKGLLGTLLAF